MTIERPNIIEGVRFGYLDRRPSMERESGSPWDWSLVIDGKKVILQSTGYEQYEAGLGVAVHDVIKGRSDVYFTRSYMIIGGQSILKYPKEGHHTPLNEDDIGVGIVDHHNDDMVFLNMKRNSYGNVYLRGVISSNFPIGTPVLYEVRLMDDATGLIVSDEFEELEPDYTKFFDQRNPSPVKIVLGDKKAGHFLFLTPGSASIEDILSDGTEEIRIRLNGLPYDVYFTDNWSTGLSIGNSLRLPRHIVVPGDYGNGVDGGLESILESDHIKDTAKLILREAHRHSIVL